MGPIDLDQNATSPLDPEVLEAMRPFWLSGGNPDSRHPLGRSARRALIASTETVCHVLHAHPEELIFTSGGTEANNLAIFGLLDGGGATRRIVSSPIEHPAVVEPVAKLEKMGYEVERPSVDTEGLADPERMAEAASRDGAIARLATLILAHNETGAIQPVGKLAKLMDRHGIPVHTDAVQAVGRIPVDFRELGVATLAASAHKFGGPTGVGLLLVRRGVSLTPILHGGGQQRGLRPGTVPVALIVGLAAALEKWHREAEIRTERWATLRDFLEARLIAAFGPERVVRNGPIEPKLRLPQTLNVGFVGLDADALRMQIDLAGVCVSFGSACASGSTRPSPSLVAMHVPEDRIRTSVRFSLGAATTRAEVEEAATRIVAAVERAGDLREFGRGTSRAELGLSPTVGSIRINRPG